MDRCGGKCKSKYMDQRGEKCKSKHEHVRQEQHQITPEDRSEEKITGEDQLAEDKEWTDEDEGTDIEDTIAEEEDLGDDITPEEELRLLAEDLKTPLENLGYGSNKRILRSSNKVTQVDVNGHCNGIAANKTKDLCKDDTSAGLLKTLYTDNATRGESDEEDGEYMPISVGRREVRVGEDYQAAFGMNSLFGDLTTDNSELMWRPPVNLREKDVINYLVVCTSILKNQQNPPQASTSQASTSQASTSQASTSQASTSQASTSQASTIQASTSQASTIQASTSQASAPVSNNSTVPDNEYALKTLLEMDYNVANAIIRIAGDGSFYEIRQDALTDNCSTDVIETLFDGCPSMRDKK